jgi:hypothetical protein
VEVIFTEDSGNEDPVGGIEVVTKPPLGKCSINIYSLWAVPRIVIVSV